MTLSAYPTYESYKSGVAPWLGDVPTAWRFEKAKWFLSHRKQLNSAGKIDNVLSLTLRGVVNNDPDNPEGLVPKDYRTYQVFEADDLVFKLIDLENVRTSRVGLVHEQGIMSSAYIRIVPPSGWDARFLYYYYYHLYEAEVFNKIGSGVRSTLGQSDLLELPIPVIDLELQRQIVRLLDEKCAKVDVAVRIKEEQIALLRERRQVLIQQAVTRGLNPDAPMKDSGIDWIGQIPAHWEVKRLGLCLQATSARNRPDLPLLSITRELGVIERDVDDQESNHNFIPEDLSGYRVLRAGQFGMNKMKAWQGSYGISPITGIVSPAYYVFDLVADVEPSFFNLAIRTGLYVSFFYQASDGIRIGQWDLSRERMKQIPFLMPRTEEQLEIVKFAANQTEKIHAAIQVKLDQIAALKEYKTSLINAAVTGKIKVA